MQNRYVAMHGRRLLKQSFNSLYLLIYFAFFLYAPLSFAGAREDKLAELARQNAIKNADLYYDEVFDKNGNIREQYKKVFPIYLNKTKIELDAFRRATKKDFGGDNALSGLPRLMPQTDFEIVKTGVEQRGLALLRFLQDHYSGDKKYLKDNIIPESVIKGILERAGEHRLDGHIKPENIRFMYGPDIIRDAQGTFRVLEDNTSYLGGQGDLLQAKNSIYKRMPEMGEALDKIAVANPISFYKNLLSRYKAEMKNPNDRIIVFAMPPYPDAEDGRLRKIWKSLGVEWVIPGGKKQLAKKSDGIYLEWKESGNIKSEKVGYIIFNGEFVDADTSLAPMREMGLVADAKSRLSFGPKDLSNKNRKKIERLLKPDPKTGKINYDLLEKVLREDDGFVFEIGHRKVPGLIEAINSGQVLSNNTPGTEFINDKEFNMYVEDLIKYYLGEEPVLRNLPSKRLYATLPNGSRVVDEKVFQELAQNMDKYVVKVVDGRGGEGIWVGPKLSPSERQQLLKNLKLDTSRETIIQEYKHPSVLGGDIVDLRVFSQVGGKASGKIKEVFVPDIGWVRGVGLSGDGKVNLSAGTAHEVLFMVTKNQQNGTAIGDCRGHYETFNQ